MIGRLARVTAVEMRKLAHRQVGYVAVVLAAIGAGLTVLSFGFQRTILQLAGEKASAGTLNGFEVLAEALKNGVFAGAVPLLVLAGVLMAEERELGTAKIVFSKPIRRYDVVFAKGFVLCLLALLVVLTAAGTASAVISLKGGYTAVAEFHPDTGNVLYIHHEIDDMLPNAWTAVALQVPPLAALLIVVLLLSSVSRQSGVAVGAGFGALALMGAVGTFEPAAQDYLLTRWLTFPSTTLKALALGQATDGFFEHRRAYRDVLMCALVPAATGALAWLLTAVITWRRQILGIALAAGLGALLAASPASALGFRISELRVEGQVWSMRATDMDGDDRTDLCVLVIKGAQGPNPVRELALFYQTEEGGYPTAPDQVVPVPPTAIARILEDLDPTAKGREIAWVTKDGITALRAKDRRYGGMPVTLVKESSLYDMASGSELPSWDDGAIDVDGDGRTDLLVLRKGDCVLYCQKEGGGFEKRATFPLFYRQRFGPRVESQFLKRFLSFRGELGRPVLTDVNGDGRIDLVCLIEKELLVYLQGPGGRFSPDPALRARVPLLSDDGEEEDELNQINLDIVDVDGDKRSDLFLFRNQGKVGVFESLRTQVMLFRAGEDGWSTSKPTQVINLNGLSMTPALIDIDADGRRDLVVSSVRTDLISNVGTALFSEVTVTYHIFLYKPSEGRFGKVADWSKDITVDVSRVEGGGTIPLVYFWGDYDGDGKRDMLSLEKQDLVQILPSRIAKGGLFSEGGLSFSESEKTEIRLETSNSSKMQDVNWDGKHDLIFWYWDDDWKNKERGKIAVVLSK